MKHLSVVVRADWDDETRTWVATSSDVDGLAVEAGSLEELETKVVAAISDLLEFNGFRFELAEIPVHIVAQRCTRVANPFCERASETGGFAKSLKALFTPAMIASRN
jgi:hypothetical protein